ncbi:hypothetical protein ACSBR1_020327 [Camellia fascicularis]
MDGGEGGGSPDDLLSTTTTTATAIAFAAIYIIRVYLVQGFYIMSYGLGIYILNLLIEFISPKTDPAFQDPYDDGSTLPTRGSDEFCPFVCRLP